jgi:23S rRNA (cytosine1962-C5)-methyltransferase
MKDVRLKKIKRLLSGHLWVFSNEVASTLSRYEPGEIVNIIDRRGNFLAIGYINPHSLITIRVLSKKKVDINRRFLKERISDAINYRKAILGDISSCRLVFGEADLLPGVIIDKYNDILVVQLLTAGAERLKEMILDVLEELMIPSAIVVRNDTPFRSLEGLIEERYIARGDVKEYPVIKEGDIRILVDIMEGQKTGFFLDQRENRIAFSSLIKGGKGLDLFSYSGAWALHIAKRGGHVIAVDSSSRAVEMINKNAAMNNLSDRIECLCADVFDFLDAERSSRNQYDFIVLDPPAFVKSKTALKKAISGYKAINANAVALLKRGGLLATSSCSHHLSQEAFLDIIQYAAKVNQRYLRIIELRSQGRDHPVLATMPETKYLKCAFIQVI